MINQGPKLFFTSRTESQKLFFVIETQQLLRTAIMTSVRETTRFMTGINRTFKGTA